MDEELLSEFLTESNENLASIEQQLMDLEANPQDIELLDSIFRVIHTVKGSCGFLKLKKLEKVAHAGENLLDRIRQLKYQVNEEIVSLLLACADAITQLLEGLETSGEEPEVDHADLIERLQTCERMVSEQSDTGIINTEERNEVSSCTSWLANFDEAVTQALDEAGFCSVDEVMKAGFTTLKAMDALTPSDALKILGIAKAVVQSSAKPESIEEPPIIEAKEKIPTPTTVKKEATKKEDMAKQIEPSKGRTACAPSIRVDISLLDELMNQVGELVLTRNSLVQMIQASGSMDLMRVGRDVDQITEQLQAQLLRTRMQPIQTIWSSVPRIVRDIGKQLDKKIKVVMEGEDTELDRTILNALKDPLTHIIRNSCDHGIEFPQKRLENNKPEQGVLRLSAVQESGFILITIHDDGGGIDANIIKAKALKMGVLTDEQAENISDKAALQLIFHAGLSTAEKVTNFSGRGVGMDVVRTEIEKVGGSVDIDSTLGAGTSLRIRIPLTLAIISAMVIECEGQRFAIPQMSVQELLSTPIDSEDWRLIAGQPFYRLRGKLLPVMRLKQTLDLSHQGSLEGSIVVVDLGDRIFGILVDQIHGAEEIVVKPLGIHFQHLGFYGGCSILGDGSVIPIFDCNGLASMIQVSSEVEAEQHLEETTDLGVVDSQQHTLLFNQAGMRYAIPMTLVERLEYIKPNRIEATATGEVLQYRGELITVLRWADLLGKPSPQSIQVDDEEEVYCLILSDGSAESGKRMCLQVDDVEDIIEVPMDVKKSSDNTLFLGTTVIQGVATEVVNVFEVVQRAIPDWFSANKEGERRKVLFVEDAKFFRQLVIPVLETLNFTIRVAEDGEQAQKVLQTYTPDLVITDIEMPVMNGIALAEWIKTQPNLSAIPIVALTGRQGFDADSHQADVFDDVLSKMDSQSLAQSITHILEQREQTNLLSHTALKSKQIVNDHASVAV